MINSKQHRGCGIQDPGTHGYRWWKTADFSHSAGTAHGAPPECWYAHKQLSQLLASHYNHLKMMLTCTWDRKNRR